jgi:AcrR family transcriptional regulator
MAYRRTENVVRRLAARHDAILAAAGEVASRDGIGAIQIAPIAARAGIAAGTVYRYFPSKSELVGALIARMAEREIGALRRAGDAAPGPLSALAAAIMTFAARASQNRRLAWAALAEPIDADIDRTRIEYRRALAGELELRIRTAIDGGRLPGQDARLAAAALVGVLLEGMIGPLAPPHAAQAASAREAAQMLTLIALRGLGVPDAHARGLVMQAAAPGWSEMGSGWVEQPPAVRPRESGDPSVLAGLPLSRE